MAELLLHFDGSDNDTTTTTSGTEPFNLSGSFTLSTSQYKFGTSSLYLSSSSDYLTVQQPAWNNIAFGYYFTIDLWVRVPSVSGEQTIFTIPGSSGGRLYLNGSAVCFDYPSYSLTSGSGAISANQWHHIAIVGNHGSYMRLFVDGTLVDSDYYSTELVSSGNSFTIGNSMVGYIDEFRWIREIMWTDNFTPPTSPYVSPVATDGGIYYSYTIVMHHFVGEHGSTDDIFRRSMLGYFNYRNFSISGSCYCHSSGRYGSCYYSGNTGYYLYTTDSELRQLYSNDYSFDFFIKFSSVSITQTIFNIYKDSSNNFKIYLASGSPPTLTLRAYKDNSYYFRARCSYNFQTDTWYHIYIARKNNKTYMAINGVMQTVEIVNGSECYTIDYLMESGFTTRIGEIYGYLEEFRYNHRYAQWTSDFTVPTNEYFLENSIGGIDDYTKLCLHFDSDYSDSSYFNNDGTAYGNASISTSTKKWGAGALSLVNGGYVSIPYSSDFNFASYNFTIDFWVYFTSLPSSGEEKVIFRQYIDSNNVFKMYVFNSNDESKFRIVYKKNGTTYFDQYYQWQNISTNTWYHIAIVVASNGYTGIYYNGYRYIESGGLNPNLEADFEIGSSGGDSASCYIDEFRISKIARWYPGSYGYVPNRDYYNYAYEPPTYYESVSSTATAYANVSCDIIYEATAVATATPYASPLPSNVYGVSISTLCYAFSSIEFLANAYAVCGATSSATYSITISCEIEAFCIPTSYVAYLVTTEDEIDTFCTPTSYTTSLLHISANTSATAPAYAEAEAVKYVSCSLTATDAVPFYASLLSCIEYTFEDYIDVDLFAVGGEATDNYIYDYITLSLEADGYIINKLSASLTIDITCETSVVSVGLSVSDEIQLTADISYLCGALLSSNQTITINEAPLSALAGSIGAVTSEILLSLLTDAGFGIFTSTLERSFTLALKSSGFAGNIVTLSRSFGITGSAVGSQVGALYASIGNTIELHSWGVAS